MDSKISLFIDSGAHSLYEKKAKVMGRRCYDYFETEEFWKYVDDYAAFLREHGDSIDVYANVDVIFNPEMTWKVHQYLKKEHGLNPLPVVHFGTDLKWLKKYMEETDYIAIGGLGQEVSVKHYNQFADRVFDMICDKETGLPQCRLHGFAVTSVPLMIRYPWYSVDSTTWCVASRFGSVYVPITGGKIDYLKNYQNITVSNKSPGMAVKGHHINTMPAIEKEAIVDYLNSIGFVLGHSDIHKEDTNYVLKEGEKWFKKKEWTVETIVEEGLCNSYVMRDEANIHYFKGLEEALPAWPWPFRRSKFKGLLI